MPPSSTTSVLQGSTSVTEPLYQVKLLSALRSGDPALIHPFLNEISKDKRRSIDGDFDTGAAALHLAIRCGSVETIQLLLSHRAISPNGVHPPGSGTTALHLAASLGRADVVNSLLEQEDINDALVDPQGRTCKEVAKGKDVVRAIENSREFLNASYRSLLHSYIMSPPNSQPSPALLSLLESPRVKHIDLSYLDDDSGNSLLHEAAKRKDLRLIELAVRAGADVFVRDRRGRVAYEGTGKDDRVRVFLRQFANHDTTLIQASAPVSEPPTLKGYLNKYTNVAKGYNTRWFVLRNGVLSYYRHQEDETITSRGSISMRTAILKIPSATTDKLRFEVHSTPSRGHQSVQKWYMKANHPVEAARWTQAIGKSIEWHKREGNSPGASGTDGDGERPGPTRSNTGDGILMARKRSSGESERSTSNNGHGHASSQSIGTASVLNYGSKSTISIPSSIPSAPSRSSISGMSIKRVVTKGRHILSGTSHTISSDGTRTSENEEPVPHTSPQPSHQSHNGDMEDGIAANGEHENDATSLDDESSMESIKAIPYNETFDLHGNATAAQVDLTAQLLSNLSAEVPQLNKNKHFDALRESYLVVQGMMNEYMQMTKDRDDWYKRKLASERHRQRVWEESLATVVKEGEMLENELRMRSRKRGSRFFDVGTGSGFTEGMGTLKARKRSSFLVSQPPIEEGAQMAAISPRGSLFKPLVQSPGIEGLPGSSDVPPTPKPVAAVGRSETQETVIQATAGQDDDMDDTDDEDEFFDAIEANTIPNLVVPEQLKSPTHSMDETILSEDLTLPYIGYRNLRTKLDVAAERPPTSLWSVLKHSIGKDLTKISFPVFFNEPTSMLQRMAEDMEFSECLDAAVHERDAHRRIAFVAAFAMSNYSSTIGRIAKPFNPMLNETFEYVRLDKDYRYFSEQVSHHPPISACWAESPIWNYYGEVDAQNKFMGKSFEIRPTGVAHAELLIPEEWAPDYPKASGKLKGKVIEHYTWKKVTTSVSGFILGSPTIDHYGDMIITNHRTKDTCILTFKPRGWRGKDAYEISGQVLDSRGRVVLDIAGRWNSQLIARTAGSGTGELHPDLPVSGATSPSASPEFFLLWRNSEKPSGTPFNLTPFALTLNDCPKDTLKPYICPTDCRLRPDQRAFETGYYEQANDLKLEQEEKQRATRRAREEGQLPPHRPRWFTAETDGDTGERVWTPSRVDGKLEYWDERQKVWQQKQKGQKGNWKDVEAIFVDEPEFLR
ncbi:oxysterol-binding protein [Moniliophthora roreri MCA 2997]|uniref:Oxysterol-binding protein n=1 Tax=Moniliophthora roreri (strain MCA 2997) TaxID=1381753 RepID=V2YNZ8_MONRO|nr:oxysterol-binding protein [Moniliophthora roreri MCA 2997]